MNLRRIRQCRTHLGVELLVRAGVPWCPFGPGHYPDEWLEVDTDRADPATVEAPAAAADTAYREEWRASVGKALPAPRPRPKSPPAALVIKPRPSGVERSPATPVQQKENDMSLKCSNCGGAGHNRRTCKEAKTSAGSATTAIAKTGGTRASRKPRAKAHRQKARPATSKALVLSARGRADLERRRNELIDQVQELDSALTTFDLVDGLIPKVHVDAARALLEQAGADLGAKQPDGRQQLALTKVVAGVGAALYAATLRSERRRQEILAAAAAAISGEAKES